MSLVRYGDLDSNKYIDDNALLVLYLLVYQDAYEDVHFLSPFTSLKTYTPPGWNPVDTKALLITIADEYSFPVENITFCPDDDNLLAQMSEHAKEEDGREVLSPLLDNRNDITESGLRSLIKTTVNARDSLGASNEHSGLPAVCKKCMEYISFDITPDQRSKEDIKESVHEYISRFADEDTEFSIDDEPWKYTTSPPQGVSYNPNVYTPKKQVELMQNMIQGFEDNYGDKFKIKYPGDFDFSQIEEPPAGISWFKALYVTKSFLPTHALLVLKTRQIIEISTYSTSRRTTEPEGPTMPQQVFEITILDSLHPPTEIHSQPEASPEEVEKIEIKNREKAYLVINGERTTEVTYPTYEFTLLEMIRESTEGEMNWEEEGLYWEDVYKKMIQNKKGIHPDESDEREPEARKRSVRDAVNRINDKVEEKAEAPLNWRGGHVFKLF
jgi:hypothetical protein